MSIDRNPQFRRPRDPQSADEDHWGLLGSLGLLGVSPSLGLPYPEGPSTQYLRTLVSKFGTRASGEVSTRDPMVDLGSYGLAFRV